MHTLTVAMAPRTATTPRGPSRAALLVLLPVAVALVAVAAPGQQPDLAGAGGDGPAGARWSVSVPGQAPCGPLPAELPPAAALDAVLDCEGAKLAAHARALELDPVR